MDSDYLLGFIRKRTAEPDWEIEPNQLYDTENKNISIINKEVCGEYRIARIEGQTSVTDEKGSRIELLMKPCVITADLHLEFQLENTSNLVFKIVDLSGKIVYTRKQRIYPSGIHKLNIDLAYLLSGTYILQLDENDSRSKVKTIKI